MFADESGMNLNSISAYSGGYVDSLLSNALQSEAVSSTSTTSAGSISAIGQASDSSQLSPFAQILSTLQQLQQSNPAEYQQVTKTIASNLQTAAQTVQAQGDTAAASGLSQLANDFSTASSSGQLPSIQDLAKAIDGGHHHHGHGGGHAESQTSTDSDSSTAISGDTSSQSLNPLSIILSTLNSSTGTNNQS